MPRGPPPLPQGTHCDSRPLRPRPSPRLCLEALSPRPTPRHALCLEALRLPPAPKHTPCHEATLCLKAPHLCHEALCPHPSLRHGCLSPRFTLKHGLVPQSPRLTPRHDEFFEAPTCALRPSHPRSEENIMPRGPHLCLKALSPLPCGTLLASRPLLPRPFARLCLEALSPCPTPSHSLCLKALRLCPRPKARTMPRGHTLPKDPPHMP
ncbi:hypothetical protein KY284_013761 [Solanum tuberosum]|nr:hypothetical protein KY284_013761 [Solanum tuberosum]